MRSGSRHRASCRRVQPSGSIVAEVSRWPRTLEETYQSITLRSVHCGLLLSRLSPRPQDAIVTMRRPATRQKFPNTDAVRLGERNPIAERGADVHRQLFATVGFVQDWEVAPLDTARRIARHQEDRQTRTQHPRLASELESVDAARH